MSHHPTPARLATAALVVLSLAGLSCRSEPGDAPAATDGKAEATAATSSAPAAATQPAAAAPADPAALLDPAALAAKAPETFTARFSTTKGDFDIKVTRAWSPNGADRFYTLVKSGFYDDVAFFRVISGFMAQFGLHGQPGVNAAWRSARIPDDPVVESNTRGMVSFAMSGPNTRTSQLFINFGDNVRLDGMGFSAFGQVSDEGMKVVDSLYSGYGEGAPRGRGPNQGLIQSQGNEYLRAQFPELDYVLTARLVD